MRILLYSHDSMGLGSMRRQLAVATALHQSAPHSELLLATSADEASHFNVPANCKIIKLPGLQKHSSGELISPHNDSGGSKTPTLRTTMLLKVVRQFRPTILLVDKHPFGVREELNDPIDAAKSIGTRVVLGLRDILDDREVVQREWLPGHTQQRVAEYFDRILIYGTRSIFDSVKEYQFSARFSERIEFCGYVVSQSDDKTPPDFLSASAGDNHDDRPSVLATVGGGEDGFDLLKIFIECAKTAGWHGSVVAGPLICSKDYRTLQQLAATNDVTIRRFSPYLTTSFSVVNAIVCMGGYNTLAEALCKGVPVVCVPRTKPRSEQLLRASVFEQLGLLKTIKPDDLNPSNLSLAINDALKTSRSCLLARVNSLMKFNGAEQAAGHIINLCSSKPQTSSDANLFQND